jgi:hypothetical protein
MIAIAALGLTKVQHGGHMQSAEKKGQKGKLSDENSGSAEFWGVKRESRLLLRDEPALLDVQLLDFRVQPRAGNSEFRCRTFWAGDFPFAFR